MNPFSGPLYALKGFRLIRQPGLRRYVLIPLLVNIVLFSSAIWLSTRYFETFMTGVLPQGYDWLQWLLWPLFAIAMLLTTFYTFTLVANFFCAPFNGLLAEAVENHLTGKTPGENTSLMQVLKETPKSLWSEVRKLGYFVIRAIPLFILFLIPGLNLLAPLLWFAFSAWLLAREYLDYPMSNHGLYFRQQNELIRQQRITSLGFGASIMVLTMIPVVNFIVMPLAVAGATALYLEKLTTSP